MWVVIVEPFKECMRVQMVWMGWWRRTPLADQTRPMENWMWGHFMRTIGYLLFCFVVSWRSVVVGMVVVVKVVVVMVVVGMVVVVGREFWPSSRCVVFLTFGE